MFIWLGHLIATKAKTIYRNCTKNSDEEDGNDEKDNSSYYHNNLLFVNDCMVKDIPKQSFVFSVTVEFITSFFQMVSLVSFNQDSRKNETMTRIIDFFNLQIAVDLADDICPSPHVSTVMKYFIKNVFFIVTMLLFIFIIVCIYKLLLKIQRLSSCNLKTNSDCKNTEIKLTDKFLIGFVKVLMFRYKNISLFTILVLHCTEVSGDTILFISADVKCYQGWQWLVMVFLFIWVIPFPTTLILSYKLMKRGSFDKLWFIISLLFPPLSPAFMFYTRNKKQVALVQERDFKDLLYEMFEEPYRVTAINNDNNSNNNNNKNDDDSKMYSITSETLYWWTAWRLYERLFIVALTTYMTQPIIRISVIIPVIICLELFHVYVMPYKVSMPVLTLLDISSLACLMVHAGSNFVQLFTTTFPLPPNYPFLDTKNLFINLKIAFTPISFLGYYIFLNALIAFKNKISSLF